MALLKFILYAVVFYYCFIFVSRFLVRFFFKKWMHKMQRDVKQKFKKDDYKKHRNGETEFSYQKDQSIDPGGDYVDFEEINDKK